MNPQKFNEQILNNALQMDASVNFQLNGNMLIVPCPWESDKEVTNGEHVRYRGGIEVDADGRTRVKRYKDGSKGPLHETLYETAHGAVKMTRPQIRPYNGRRRIDEEYVYVTFKFPKKYGLALTKALYQEEADEIMSYFKTSTTDDEQQRKLKSWLPFRCPHYTQFRDDYRDREHIVAESFTWQTCIDIDDPELVEKANEMSERLDIEAGGQWQGLMLHKDYSIRRKLHIDIRLPLGMTVPEAQREYCKALGVECDTSCFSPERFIYISPADFEIYRADGWYAQLSDEEVAERRKAYTDRGLSIDGRTEDGSYYDPEGDTQGTGTSVTSQATSQMSQSPCVAEATEGRYPGEFKGVAYTSIISEYWCRTGGEPSEGERNKRLHQLAANLRAICDNSEEWLLEVMPRFGLSEAEMKSIIHSACKEPTKGSRLIDQIVSALEMGISSDEIEDAEAVQAETGVKVNVRTLPIGLKESLTGVPVSMHMPVLCGVLPIAAAYADQVNRLLTSRLSRMPSMSGSVSSTKRMPLHANVRRNGRSARKVVRPTKRLLKTRRCSSVWCR